MKQLVFQQIAIISDYEKSANLFQFAPKKNLILGTANNVGKTCLCTSLFWTLGVDVKQQKSWKKLKVRTVLEFSIFNDMYSISRHENVISIVYPDFSRKTFYSLKDFSFAFAEIIDFKACARVKNSSNRYEIPYTSLQLLRSFIHQDLGWSELFKSLSSYSYNKTEANKIVDYFLGLKPDEYFEPLLKKTPLIEKTAKLEGELDKITFVKDKFVDFRSPILRDYISKIPTNTVSNDKLDYYLEQEVELKALLFNHKKELFAFKEEFKVLSKAESELFDDYQYATNNLEGQSLLCPTCGTEHENDIISRFGLLSERDDISKAKVKINSKINSVKNEIKLLNEKIAYIKSQVLTHKVISNTPAHLEEQIISHAKGHFDEMMQDLFLNVIDKNESYISSLSKEIKNINDFKPSKQQRNKFVEIKKEFYSSLLNNFEKLNIEDIQSFESNKMIYNFDVSGSDISRSILAYYKTLNDISSKYCKAYTLPFVLDTPFQQEQDDDNISYIAEFLSSWDTQQLFIFGMNQSSYKSLLSDDSNNVIWLSDKKSLLSKSKYDAIRNDFDELFF